MSPEEEISRLRLRLERERTARKEAEAIGERATRELYTTVEKLRALNESLSAPALVIQDGVVVMPVIGNMDKARAQKVSIALVHGCHQHRARALIIDVTGMSVIEPAAVPVLAEAARAASVLGARVIVTGIAPEVALALTDQGVGQTVETAGDLADGIERSRSATVQRR
jgi:rsbT co-antagonist protein RsbR